jgi:hypothetical protein
MKSKPFVPTVMVCLMSGFFSDTGYGQGKGKGGSGTAQAANKKIEKRFPVN